MYEPLQVALRERVARGLYETELANWDFSD
jgi:hypothetical protein